MVSYSIYLLHVSVIVAARQVVGSAAPNWLVFATSLAATRALAELSFRFYEWRFLAAKPDLSRRQIAASGRKGPPYRR